MKWDSSRISHSLVIHTAQTPIGYYQVRDDKDKGISCGLYPQNSWSLPRQLTWVDVASAIETCEQHWTELVQRINEYNSN